ncbi:hypothetical protein [Amaricoccus sp.]|uniref:hypothetical protein n=1 Tax=Amaricoccus sp. TaxID=1872485 RepID=UPI001B573C79|nr:hypothetical protein [Amaricoccus sp.]MBP7003625.1 hypothetical protein [Amaricoccus sp.]
MPKTEDLEPPLDGPIESLKDYRATYQTYASSLAGNSIVFAGFVAVLFAIFGFFLQYQIFEQKAARVALIQSEFDKAISKSDQSRQTALNKRLEELNEEIKQIKSKEISVSLLGTSVPSKVGIATVLFSGFAVVWLVRLRGERRRLRILIGGFVGASASVGRGGAYLGDASAWLAPIGPIERHEILNPRDCSHADALRAVGWTTADHQRASATMGAVAIAFIVSLVCNAYVAIATTDAMAVGYEITTPWMGDFSAYVSIAAVLLCALLLLDEFVQGGGVRPDLRRRGVALGTLASLTAVGAAVLWREGVLSRNSGSSARGVTSAPRYLSASAKKHREIAQDERRMVVSGATKRFLSAENRKYKDDVIQTDVISESIAIHFVDKSIVLGMGVRERTSEAISVLFAKVIADTSRARAARKSVLPLRIADLCAGLCARSDDHRRLSELIAVFERFPLEKQARDRVVRWKDPNSKWAKSWRAENKRWSHPTELAREGSSGSPREQRRIDIIQAS